VNEKQNDIAASFSEDEIKKIEEIKPEFENLVNNLTGSQSRAMGDEAAEPYGELLYSESVEFLKEKFGEEYTKYLESGTFISGINGPVNENLSVGARATDWGTVQFLHAKSETGLPWATGMYFLSASGKYVRLPWGSWAWVNLALVTQDGDIIGGAEKFYISYQDEVTSPKIINLSAIDAIKDGVINLITETTSAGGTVSGEMKWGFFPKVTNIRTRMIIQHPLIREASHGVYSHLPGTFNWVTGSYDTGLLVGSM
jgi:hypothetical protein